MLTTKDQLHAQGENYAPKLESGRAPRSRKAVEYALNVLKGANDNTLNPIAKNGVACKTARFFDEQKGLSSPKMP